MHSAYCWKCFCTLVEQTVACFLLNNQRILIYSAQGHTFEARALPHTLCQATIFSFASNAVKQSCSSTCEVVSQKRKVQFKTLKSYNPCGFSAG